MPLWDFKCGECGEVQEHLIVAQEIPLHCGKAMSRVYGGHLGIWVDKCDPSTDFNHYRYVESRRKEAQKHVWNKKGVRIDI